MGDITPEQIICLIGGILLLIGIGAAGSRKGGE